MTAASVHPSLPGPDLRLLAWGIDAVLRAGAGLLGACGGLGAAALVGADDHDAMVGMVTSALASACVELLQAVLITRTGQSIGKRWTGLRIERPDGTPPGFWRGVVLRSWVAELLDTACGVFLLIDGAMLLRPDRRAVHDHLAGTRVVWADAPGSPGS